MSNFDWRSMSKLTSVGNGIQYLRLEGDSTWTLSDKDQTYIFSKVDIAYDVSMLDAKLHPISGIDRDAMVTSLEDAAESYQKFLNEYGRQPNWKSTTEIKDARRGLKRMKKEITRLRGMEFSGGDHK